MATKSPIPCPKPGIYHNIPDNQYRAWDAVNQSSLKDLLECGADMVWRKGHPKKTTRDMIQGTAIHTGLFEPELFAERYVWPLKKLNGATKAGKAQKAELEKLIEGTDKIILTFDEYYTAQHARDAIMEHPVASDILASPGHREVCAVWKYGDVVCKQRMDWMSDDRRVIVDVKSTVSARRGAFWGQARRLGYHMQAAFYRDGLAELEQICATEIIYAIIAVEKTGRYAVAVYYFDGETMRRGAELYGEAMATLIECQEPGTWPGYNNDEIATIGYDSNPYAGDDNGRADTTDDTTTDDEDYIDF